MENYQYKLVESAILYIREHCNEQPSLEKVAAHVNLSPLHFQKVFKDWCGVSPKKFLQYSNLAFAKKLLNVKNSVSDTAFQTGLSSNSRLHDLFVSIEGMTPAQYKNGGKNLTIHYYFYQGIFGQLLIASTQTGICHVAFVEDDKKSLSTLQSEFPMAAITQMEDPIHDAVLKIFDQKNSSLEHIKLHIKGTPFQLKVWEALLKIPAGNVATYRAIAEKISAGKGFRAVGSAVGQNPIAFLIPCHRVVNSSGVIGGYRWGSDLKRCLLSWEMAKFDPNLNSDCDDTRS